MSGAPIIATASLAGVVVLATLSLAALVLNLNRGLRRDFEWRFDAIETRLDAIEKRISATGGRRDVAGCAHAVPA